MCGTSTNGFRPLKVPVALIEAVRKPARRSRPGGLFRKGNEDGLLVTDLNKKNAFSREKFFDSNYACKRVPLVYRSNNNSEFLSRFILSEATLQR